MAKASKHFEQKIQILIIFEGLGQNLVDLVYPGPGAQGPPLVSLVALGPEAIPGPKQKKNPQKTKKTHKSTHAVVESTFMFFFCFLCFLFLFWAWEALQSPLLRAPY